MKKVITSLILGYVMLAVLPRGEAAGLLACDCYPDCWCQKPGLNIFRWVFPRYHHNPAIDAARELLPEGST